MTSRYNFKLVERDFSVDFSKLPQPVRLYSEREQILYGIDATRYAGFEGLDSPMGGLKFLNRLWNMPGSDILHDDVFLNRVKYYMSEKKYHNVIALVRGEMKHKKQVSLFMLDTLYPFVPCIVSKLKEIRKSA